MHDNHLKLKRGETKRSDAEWSEDNQEYYLIPSKNVINTPKNVINTPVQAIITQPNGEKEQPNSNNTEDKPAEFSSALPLTGKYKKMINQGLGKDWKDLMKRECTDIAFKIFAPDTSYIKHQRDFYIDGLDKYF